MTAQSARKAPPTRRPVDDLLLTPNHPGPFLIRFSPRLASSRAPFGGCGLQRGNVRESDLTEAAGTRWYSPIPGASSFLIRASPPLEL